MKNKSQLVGFFVMLLASAIFIWYADGQSPTTSSLSVITVGNNTYDVPMSVGELMDAGYTIMASDSPTLTKYRSNVTYFINDKGYVVTTDVRTKNETDEVQNGVIVDILADKGNTPGSELSIQGITFDSTEEEVREVFGDPIFDLDGDTLYLNHIRENGVDTVSVLLTDGVITRLEVCNTEGYEPLEE